MKRSMTLALSVAAVLGVNNLYADTIFCVHDKGLNDSQFCAGGDFAEDTPTPILNMMGLPHEKCDIEALDVIYDPGNIYAASGDDTPRPGHLYRVNRVNSGGNVVDLTIDDLGGVYYKNGKKNVKLREIDGISADPDDGVLWGWAQGQGLFKIAAAPLIPGIDAEAIPSIEDKVGNCTAPTNNFAVEAEMVISTTDPSESDPIEIEDIEWNEDGEVLYGVENIHVDHDGDGFVTNSDVDYHHEKDENSIVNDPQDRDYDAGGVKLWAYNQTAGTITHVCTLLDFSSLPVGGVIGEVEGLDSLPRSFFNQLPGTDTLLLTFHGSNTLPFVVIKTPPAGSGTCDILYAGESIAAGDLNDIEGIAYGPTVAFF